MRVLTERGHEVAGLDAGFYDGCELSPLLPLDHEIRKDIRAVTPADVRGCDAVIHLAALSNDPLGELDPRLTESINHHGTLRLATAAREAGAHRFVFASSQSMYGIADVTRPVEEDRSEKHPLTAYARTKWQAEQELARLLAPDFTLTALRPSTVFGVSPRLRCDIVFNNMVACAYTTGRIEIHSDGTPWRPVVHVRDVSAAFVAALEAPAQLVAGQAFNVGYPDGNYTVRQLAEAAQRAVPGSTLTFTGLAPDARTYRVSFDKIGRVLGPYYRPAWDLDRGGQELVAAFRDVGFSEADFRGARTNRLARLRDLRLGGKLDAELAWVQ